MVRFPNTFWSVISRARSNPSDVSRAALASLCETYWYSLYRYARSRGFGYDDARDPTQGYLLSGSPAAGSGFVYLVCGTNCGGGGSYDSGSSSQVGSSDGEIAASTHRCP